MALTNFNSRLAYLLRGANNGTSPTDAWTDIKVALQNAFAAERLAEMKRGN